MSSIQLAVSLCTPEVVYNNHRKKDYKKNLACDALYYPLRTEGLLWGTRWKLTNNIDFTECFYRFHISSCIKQPRGPTEQNQHVLLFWDRWLTGPSTHLYMWKMSPSTHTNMNIMRICCDEIQRNAVGWHWPATKHSPVTCSLSLFLPPSSQGEGELDELKRGLVAWDKGRLQSDKSKKTNTKSCKGNHLPTPRNSLKPSQTETGLLDGLPAYPNYLTLSMLSYLFG